MTSVYWLLGGIISGLFIGAGIAIIISQYWLRLHALSGEVMVYSGDKFIVRRV